MNTAIKNPVRLSILIPSIPSRFISSGLLYGQLRELSEGKDVEILMLTDNKKRTIGEKREALKNLAQGKYFMFCDDDDEFISIDEIYEATASDVDVICFKAECRNPDGSTFIVIQQLGNPVEHNTKDGVYEDCLRPPFPNCAWHNKFKKFSFPAVSYGEDWGWIKKCLRHATTEIFIDKILFKYNFNPLVTEASTESNKVWKNPNG